MMAHGKRLMVALVLLFGMNVAMAATDSDRIVTAEICDFADTVYSLTAGLYILDSQGLTTYDEWMAEANIPEELTGYFDYAFNQISVEGAGWRSTQDAQDWVDYQDKICRTMIGKVPPNIHE